MKNSKKFLLQLSLPTRITVTVESLKYLSLIICLMVSVFKFISMSPISTDFDTKHFDNINYKTR